MTKLYKLLNALFNTLLGFWQWLLIFIGISKKRTSVLNAPELTYVLKIERARKHLDDLNAALDEWFKDHSHPTRIDPDPSDPTHLFIKSGIDPIPTDPFSLVLGDVVQNLRSSLDHLIFELANVYTSPLTEEIARKSQFPIFGDETSKGVRGHRLAQARHQDGGRSRAADA